MSYVPPPFPKGLRPGGKTPSAKPLQGALKKTGYLSRLVPATDTYGPLTQAAVKRFHKAHPQYGTSDDPAIGPKGWAYLFRLAYSDVPPGEPAGDYHRVSYDGKTVNVRTKVLLMRAEALLRAHFILSQGSYSTGVSASAGTHDGGGVVDIGILGLSAAKIDAYVKALRQVGFAAWHRTPDQGFAPHIHAVAIGDRELAPLARSQMQAYFDGRNGLAGSGPDDGPRNLWPTWAEKYRK